MIKCYHVSVAAEAYAAAAFARAGYEVSVQYGANQPGYDLVAVKGERTLKVSVKGSSDGGWVVNARYKKDRTWRQALAAWFDAQPQGVVFFYVQFKNVPFNAMPRCYIARVQEVYDHMLTTRNGHISGCLYESYSYKRGIGKGYNEALPSAWEVSPQRLDSV